MKRLLAIILLSLHSSPIFSMHINQFLTSLPTDNDPAFVSKKIVDLSLYQTMSKWQPPLGSCTAFSIVAAVEAAYTKKYCKNKNSAFYKAGYCQRYEAIKAANIQPFYLAEPANAWFQSDKKDLDLSEQYFLDRVLSMWVASPQSNHESGNLLCFLDGIERGVAGDVAFIINHLSLPEENDVPYIYDQKFYDEGVTSVCQGITQEKIDSYHFSENFFKMKNWDDSEITRMFVPHEGYQHAVYGVSDLLIIQRKDLKVPLITFLEKALFKDYPVAISGAQPGHSMLLIGYDRTNKKFLFKDHYQRWVTVSYSDLESSLYELSIVLDVSNDYLQPSKEEMWLGPWQMDLDGRVGNLIIRRTRIPSNALYSEDQVSGQNLIPVPTTKWARVGTFYENNITKRTVYGRLNNSDGTTIELNINFNQIEGAADPLQTVANGYSPVGQSFTLRMFARGAGSAAYATGKTLWNGRQFGVLLTRPRTQPYLAIPHHPVTTFNRNQWAKQFTLALEAGGRAILDLTTHDRFRTLEGTIQEGNANPISIIGKFSDDNRVTFTTQNVMPGFYFELLYHTWEQGVVSGTITQLMNTVSPLYGIENRLITPSLQPFKMRVVPLRKVNKPPVYIPAMRFHPSSEN